MYKLIITINKQIQKPISFETWQSAYKSVRNHILHYENAYDELEAIFTVYNLNSAIIKNVGLLTSYGKGIFFNIKKPLPRVKLPMKPTAANRSVTIQNHILTKNFDENDLPF